MTNPDDPAATLGGRHNPLEIDDGRGAVMQQKRHVVGKLRTANFYLIIFLITIVTCVVAAEVMIRVLVPREVFWPISNIYRASEIPGIGYTLRRDFNGVAFGVDLRTNSMGFRGPEWQSPSPDGTLRIALIGDSHAFAYGVPFNESLCEVLARNLATRRAIDCEVLNFGAPGYNSRQELAILREVAIGLEPDIVLIVISSNDHDEALSVDPNGWMVTRKDVAVGNRIHDKSIDKTTVEPVSWWKHSRIVLYLKLAKKRREFAAESNREDRPVIEGVRRRRGRHLVHHGPLAQPLVEMVYEPVEQMIALAREHHARVALALVGGGSDYPTLLQRLGENEDVPVVDMRTLLPEAGSREAFKARYTLGWDSHYNAVAHTQWGKGLAEFLEESGTLSGGAPE